MIHHYHNITKDLNLTCDAVVVGSGAGGAVVGKELAEAGLHVIMIEEGGFYDTNDYLIDDPIQSLTNLYRNGGAFVIFGKPPIMLAEGRCVGGSTTINGAMCWRTPDKVMENWQKHHGMSKFCLKEMDHYFSRVENMISAKPMIPEAKNQESELLRAGAEKLGYKYRTNIRSQDHCVGSNLCITGCPTGAKKSTAVSYIPEFLKHNGELYTHCRVLKVLTKEGRAVGIKGKFIDPLTKQKTHKLTVKSKFVIVCGGAIQTPALLLKSGIKDQNKLLGKNLITHPNAKVLGVFDKPVRSWQGVNQNYQITEYFDEGILMAVNSASPGVLALAMPLEENNLLKVLKEEFNHLTMGGVLIEDTGRGRVRVGPFDSVFPIYNLNKADFQKTIRGVALYAELLFAAGAKRCYLPFSQLHVIHSPDEIKKIYDYNFKPLDIELLTVHVMGTAQMGGDPHTSVINPFGEFHNCPNLFVADASIFPTSIGVNPQVTIMALATRTAEHIATKFQSFGDKAT